MEETDLNNLIKEIQSGQHGSPKELEDNLGKELYSKVQEKYIKIFSFQSIQKIANDVIKKKKYGDGNTRKLNLGIMWEIVQNKINDSLKCSKRHPLNEKHIEILAHRTIKGQFGIGMKRKEELNKFGKNVFKRVQNKVNEITGNPRRYNLELLSIDEYIQKLAKDEITDEALRKEVGDFLYNFIRNKVNESQENNNRFEINKECIDLLAEYTIMLEFSENEERKRLLGELFPFVQNKVNEKLGCKKRHDISNKPFYLNLE